MQIKLQYNLFFHYFQVCRQRKQVYVSEGTVEGWAGTLLSCL